MQSITEIILFFGSAEQKRKYELEWYWATYRYALWEYAETGGRAILKRGKTRLPITPKIGQEIVEAATKPKTTQPIQETELFIQWFLLKGYYRNRVGIYKRLHSGPEFTFAELYAKFKKENP